MAAVHNSQARFPPPKCSLGTRDAIIAQIVNWIEEQGDNVDKKRILWIYGPAGAGKSAIAQTISEVFSQRQALAASFFFTRGNDRRGKVDYIIATITYQLTNSIPGIRDDIGNAIARDPSVLSLSLEIQIQRLIVTPLRSFLSRSNAPHNQQYLIIIDGLDECDGDDNQSRLISLIADLFHTHNLPFTFIIASRPEPHIRDSFRNNSQSSAITQEFELDPSPEDIRTFLHTRFREMRNTHPGLMYLDQRWPSEKNIDSLVYRSSGYFIYASTVIKFIGDKDTQPTESLELVLSCKSSPFSALDDIYCQILLTVPQTSRSILISILEILLANGMPLPCRKDLETLLDLQDGNLRVILRRMHSLLRNIDSEDEGIQFVHASFQEFLQDKERSGIFHAKQVLGHAKIAKAFIRQAKSGILLWGFHRSWPFHTKMGQAEIPLAPFLEDLRAVTIDTWIQCLYMDLQHWGHAPPSETLEIWIDHLEVCA